MTRIDDKSLIQETYAASLRPEKLIEFERFWENYIDAKVSSSEETVDRSFLEQHFSMALGIVERLRYNRDDENYFDKIVKSQPGIGFIIDDLGHVISANSDAATYFSIGQKIASVFNAEDAKEIRKWMTEHNDRRSTKDSPYLFHTITWGNSETAVLFLVPVERVERLDQNQEKGRTYYLATHVDLEVQDGVLAALAEHFSLSQTEAKVAKYLANGLSVKQVSELRGTSEHTVRTQIKHILSKTASRDLSDMVRKILAYSATFNTSISQIRRVKEFVLKQNYIRTYSLILSDGRYMEYIEQGHPNGRPLLLLHCIVRGVRLTEAASREAVLRNWRIITPIRAGFGNSDPNLKATPQETVKATTEDIKQVLDHLNITKVRIITHWGGAFAGHLGLTYPDRVSGILQTSCVPVWKNEYLKHFKMRHRVILKTSIYAPAAAPYMLRVAKALIDSGRNQLFIREMDQDSDQDLEALERDKETMAVMSEGFEIYLRQGIHTFLSDVKVIHTDWSRELARLRTPITVLRGSLQQQPMSTFEAFREVVAHARIKTVEGGNIYMRFNHYKRLFDELEHL